MSSLSQPSLVFAIVVVPTPNVAEVDEIDKVVESGTSVCVTGLSWTGKSVLALDLYKRFCIKHGNEQVSLLTLSKARAMCLEGATTMFSFGGICLSVDETYDVPAFITNIKKSLTWRRNWENAKILIFDDAFLISRATMDCVDLVAKDLRNSWSSPFGGIRIVSSFLSSSSPICISVSICI